MYGRYGPRLTPLYTLGLIRSFQLLSAMPAGLLSPCSMMERCVWARMELSWDERAARLASLLALAKRGMTMAARMPRMITTIRISISVKAEFLRVVLGTLIPLLVGPSSSAANSGGDKSFSLRKTTRKGL